MKIIAAIQILIKLFTIGYGAGAVRTTGRFTAPAAAGKRADTCGFYALNSRFPLFPNPAQTRDRRPLRKGERQRILFYRRSAQCAPISLSLRSVRFRSATQAGSSMQARHNSVDATSLVGGCGRLPAGYNYRIKLYRRVRRPRRTVSVTIDTRYCRRGAHLCCPRTVHNQTVLDRSLRILRVALRAHTVRPYDVSMCRWFTQMVRQVVAPCGLHL